MFISVREIGSVARDDFKIESHQVIQYYFRAKIEIESDKTRLKKSCN